MWVNCAEPKVQRAQGQEKVAFHFSFKNSHLPFFTLVALQGGFR
jgi:hypothetical protein